MTNTALLLVDLQNDFCKGVALEVLDSESVISTANNVITTASNKISLLLPARTGILLIT
ncbi:hypothetical protein ARSQ2_02279 [Arsenophonus endosymbiont of Bemisia tabaci Q2]|nr:hypothetical protein ARSQ2_00969 [Arsenophonus endosymbiont of Bemisia tabaci Q2]CAA2931131.1 hypothetical protein ARSQ2_02279 [Arsenophonus endosymbiont of Bemisia tabaci Q2]